MKISIVHEDPLISTGIVHSFTSADIVETDSALPASLHPDTVYVCDYASGMELARRATSGGGLFRKKIVILTHYQRELDVRLALENGVSAYLLQGCGAGELATAIKAVSQGLVHIPALIAGKVAESMFRPELTERERQVLGLVAEGWVNKVIGSYLGIAEDTVKAHLKTILGKLNATSRTHAVVLALRRGIIQIE